MAQEISMPLVLGSKTNPKIGDSRVHVVDVLLRVGHKQKKSVFSKLSSLDLGSKSNVITVSASQG